MMRKKMGSCYLTIILFSLTPIAFYLANNHTQFTPVINTASLAIMACVGMVAALLCGSLLAVVGRSRAKATSGGAAEAEAAKTKAKTKPTVVDILIVSVAMIVVFPFYTRSSWGAVFPGLGLLAALAILFVVIRLFGYKFLNVFLLAFLVMSLFNLVRVEVGDAINAETSPGETLPPPAAIPYTFGMDKKPNIYLFFLESFHDRDSINSLYGFDAPELFDKLDNSEFVSYDHFYANYMGTLESALGLLSMRHHYNSLSKNLQDASRKAFAVLSNNNVFRILKHNGYSINLLDETGGYVFRQKSDIIDYRNFPFREDVFYGIRLTTQYVNPYLHYLWDFASSVLVDERRYPKVRMPNLFYEIYPRHFNLKKQPTFFYMHFGACHTLHYSRFHPQGERPDWDDHYQGKYLEAARHLERYIDLILKNDPDALVIMTGDHGAYKHGRYLGLENRDYWNGRLDINDTFREHGIEPETVGRHSVSVLTKIRWPKDVAVPAMPAKKLSHVTLFPFIFQALAGKEYDEELFDRNISMSLVSYDDEYMVMALDGELLPDWEIFALEEGVLRRREGERDAVGDR